MTDFIKDGDNGIGITHHFSSGVYAKECLIPAGLILTQHKHEFDHLSILATGTALVSVEGIESIKVGPCAITIEAGKQHSVRSMTDVAWFCIHATDVTDPAKVDESLIA